MVGVPILHILHNLVFGEGPLPVASNHIIYPQTIHHPFAMVTHSARGGMSDPLINVTDGLVFHVFPRIYQKKGQERQILGTQNRAAHLSRARRGQRHKWTGHKTFRRKSIPGNTSMNQEKGIRKRDPHPRKNESHKTYQPCDGDEPRDRVSGQ